MIRKRISNLEVKAGSIYTEHNVIGSDVRVTASVQREPDSEEKAQLSLIYEPSNMREVESFCFKLDQMNLEFQIGRNYNEHGEFTHTDKFVEITVDKEFLGDRNDPALVERVQTMMINICSMAHLMHDCALDREEEGQSQDY